MNGRDKTKDQMYEKIIDLAEFFNAISKRNDKENNVDIEIIKLYELEDIKKLTYEHMPLDTNIKGLVYYPEYSGRKYIFINSKNEQSHEGTSGYNRSDKNDRQDRSDRYPKHNKQQENTKRREKSQEDFSKNGSRKS